MARLEHDGVVLSVAFSPDGQQVATAGGDGTARVWEADTGAEVAMGAEVARLEHDGAVYSVAFSPDGRWLATTSQDRTVRVWVAPASLMETLCTYLTRNLTQDEWQRYLSQEPYHCTRPNLPPGEGKGLDTCPSTP